MRIVVIGGGAAGFFAAIHAAELGTEVIILEKSSKVLAKVKVSGGGRCNVTNACTEPGLLAGNYPRGGRELLGSFTRFGTVQTISWFEELGVALKTEPDGRMFPVTNSSQTIIDCLLSEAKHKGVQLMLNITVQHILKVDSRFKLILSGGDELIADKIIIATGGSSSIQSYTWLKNLGHTIIPPVPSLFTFNIPDNPFTDLMGLSVQVAQIKIQGTKSEQQGPLLFTHWGISGPAVLKLSAWAARWLAQQQYDFSVIINFLPELSEQQLRDELLEQIETNPLKKVISNKFPQLPARLWERLCSLAGVNVNKKWSETGKKELNLLVQKLRCTELKVKGKTTFKEEFVTCGGVSLKEVDMKTMESRKVPGLFFAGEVLDIDGVTGGFNFQAAWTTGFISGTSARLK